MVMNNFSEKDIELQEIEKSYIIFSDSNMIMS